MSPDANQVAPTWKTRLQTWADADPLQQHEAKILLALTLVIGAVVGLVVVGFILVTSNPGPRTRNSAGRRAPWTSHWLACSRAWRSDWSCVDRENGIRVA